MSRAPSEITSSRDGQTRSAKRPERRGHSRNGGSILVSLIVTMVIMGALGAGMAYMTTSSTFQELRANNHVRAYYLAESGGRYTLSVIRDAYATDIDTFTDFANTAPHTFSLADGGSFTIADIQSSGNPATVTFTSTGTVGAGFMKSRRQLTYAIEPSNQSEGDGDSEVEYDLEEMADNTITGSMDFETVTVDGDEALAVAKDQGGGGKTDAEAYVFAPDVTSGGVNPFWRNWNAGGGYSSYDVQVKVATGDVDSADLTASVPSYACGPVFRGYAVTGQRQKFLGISLVRNGTLAPPGQTADPWAKNTDYEEGDTVESDGAIYECIQAHTSKNQTKPPDPAYWETISASYIVLWIRGSNKWNGDGEWLAYKMVDDASGVVGADGEMTDWTTLVARVVEAASITLNTTTTSKKAGDTVTGEDGAGSATVIDVINEVGGNVVLLLNNVSDDFEPPTSVDGGARVEYRGRDNYIWAFYADETDRSSNNTPIDDIRLGQERGDIAWPMTAIPDWSASDDIFTLVDWNNTVNPKYPSDVHIMGTGNEANAIIRFSSDYRNGYPSTRPGPYETGADFPEEIGIVALGGGGTIFFDDFAVRISSAGGLPGSGSVVVSP